MIWLLLALLSSAIFGVVAVVDKRLIDRYLPSLSGYFVWIGLSVFAFTTILGWSYYGERCAEYLFGTRVILPFRLFWLIAIPLGAMGKLGLIWLLADVMNGLMAIPNLIAMALLSPVIFRLTFNDRRP